MRVEEIFSSKGRVKVLKSIVFHGEINLTSIIKETGLPSYGISRACTELHEMGLIELLSNGKDRLVKISDLGIRVAGQLFGGKSIPLYAKLEELLRRLSRI